MYEYCSGFFRNEVAFRDNLLKSNKYNSTNLKINKVEYDLERGELKLGLERIGYGSNYLFILFNEDVIYQFIRDLGIEDIRSNKELEGRNLMGMYTKTNILRWIIPYSISEDMPESIEEVIVPDSIDPEEGKKLDELIEE